MATHPRPPVFELHSIFDDDVGSDEDSTPTQSGAWAAGAVEEQMLAILELEEIDRDRRVG